MNIDANFQQNMRKLNSTAHESVIHKNRENQGCSNI